MTRAGPLVVSVADLLRRPGTQRGLTVEVELDGLALSYSRVMAGSPIRVEIVLESLSEAVVATGGIDLTWQGECRRCLRLVQAEADAEVREIFEADPVEGDTYVLTGEQIDLEPMVRDAVLLALPLAPVCADDCVGPDPDDYPVLTDEDDEDDVDPRWSGLQDLTFDTDG